MTRDEVNLVEASVRHFRRKKMRSSRSKRSGRKAYKMMMVAEVGAKSNEKVSMKKKAIPILFKIKSRRKKVNFYN